MAERIGFLVLGEGVILGIVLAAMGLIRIFREANSLKKRVEGYGRLPLRSDFVLASRRIDIAERAIDSLASFGMRVVRSIDDVKACGPRLVELAQITVRWIRAEIASWVVSVLGPPSKAERSPES